MFDTSKNELDYVKRFYNDHIKPGVILERSPAELTGWELNDEPVPFAEAVTKSFRPFKEGDDWGNPWSTLWLRARAEVPSHWQSLDDVDVVFDVDLNFTDQPGFQAEGLIYSLGGEPIKAINPLNNLYEVEGDELDVYLELAANPNVGEFDGYTPTLMGRKETAPQEPIYKLKRVNLAQRSLRMLELKRDFDTLIALAEVLDENSSRRFEVIKALMDAVHTLDLHDKHGSANETRDVLRPAMSKPACPGELTMFATGHAHIDSAWLWPVRETIRKCARTFANVCYLLERYPDFTFSCSSAQQFQWVKTYYPSLFERIKKHVADGRFIPVGGMWVECDANLTSGESWARQFLYGKKFFLDEFGFEPKETWLPDTFGYPASLPQISKLAGNRYFLTQKVSWNEYNVFPHHTFWWEGIDGSRQYTHFPPADTYNSTLDPKDLTYFRENFKEKGNIDIGLGLFGWGDGGGGPTPEHLANLERHADMAGLVKVKPSTSAEFFQESEKAFPDPETWVGELYLEFHRGAQSAQLATKQHNRRVESKLREVEMWSAYASLFTGLEYPYHEIESLWKVLLLNQFHDILPGTSIGWVHDQTVADLDKVLEKADELLERALRGISPDSSVETSLNPVFQPDLDEKPVGVEVNGDSFVLSNGLIDVAIDKDGHITSLRGDTNREYVEESHPAGVLHLYRDTPPRWDSWDIDRNYTLVDEPITTPVSVDRGHTEDAGIWIEYEYRFNDSSVKKRYTLNPGARALDIDLDVDWHEKQQMLKFEFPLALRANEMSSEIQFGYIDRSTTTNTLWDFARFETAAHRWVRLHEAENGVVLANDSTYGYGTRREVLDTGQTITTVGATVVRGPLYPDPKGEEGHYHVRYALRPEASVLDSYYEGYRLNLPKREGDKKVESTEIASFSDPRIIVEAVKLAEDQSGDVIVRCFEATGTSVETEVETGFDHHGFVETDLIERPLTDEKTSDEEPSDEISSLTFHPFEIKTLRFRRA